MLFANNRNSTSSQRIVTKIVSALLACLMLQSCLGGGTLGTGLPGESYGSGDSLRLTVGRVIEVDGKVTDHAGRPMTGVGISILGASDSTEVTTDQDGRFHAVIDIGRKQDLEVVFTDSEYQSNFKITNFSQTERVVHANFAYGKDRKMRLISAKSKPARIK